MNIVKQQFIAAGMLVCVCTAAMAVDGMHGENAAQGEVGFDGAFGEDALAMDGTSLRSASGNQYQFIAGSAFTARASSQVIQYPGAGCTYTNGAVTTNLQLPEGAEILGVRTYYYNNGEPGNAVATYLTSYDGEGGYTDYLYTSSTKSNGYHNELHQPVSPIPVDNYSNAYVLTATMTTGSGLRFCGMRILYQVY